MDIDKGTIIYLEDEQYFTLPDYVSKVRLEVHGGRGGKGGDAGYSSGYTRGSSGSDGSSISCILDLSKVPTLSRTLYAVKGHDGANGGYAQVAGGGGGGGGSSAILLGDILIIQAQGGRGGDGAYYGIDSGNSGAGGKGGKGYINGEDGTRGSFSRRGIGGAGGGSDYIFDGLERVDATIEYTPGLLLLEVLEKVQPTLIKSNNKYYTYQNNEFIEVEPTVENFKKKSISLSDLITPTNKVVLTMEEGEDLGDGKIFRKSINADKYGYIEGLTTQEM